jgi:glycine betaine/proline transport system substrate-binding protein
MKRILFILASMFIFTALAAAGGQTDGSADAKTADLVYANWEEGVAYTHLAQAVLEDKMGYDVTITAADVAPSYAAIAQGDKDAFMETWLPVLHKDYVDKYGDDIIDLGHVYKGTESGLVVPQYMVDAGIVTISDLLKPEAQKKLEKTITGIDAGAGVMKTTEEMVMPAYGLTDAGYKLLPSSGPAMMAALKDAVSEKRWIVVTGWKPHSMFGYWDLAFLEQDKDQVWGMGNIHIKGRKNLREEKPELATFLENMSLSTGELGSLMVAINESDKNTLEAARDWMNENEDTVADWIL